jgi:hypothetical protein
MKTPTKQAQIKQLLKDGYTLEESEAIYAERVEWAKLDRLRAEKVRLDALDTTESLIHQDSAWQNACDTVSGNGTRPFKTDSVEFLEAYVCTLSMILDSEGIAH